MSAIYQPAKSYDKTSDWVVGFNIDGQFEAVMSFAHQRDAQDLVHYLNGGINSSTLGELIASIQKLNHSVQQLKHTIECTKIR